METIKPLAKPVHSSMRSSVIIYDFTRVVEELVYNSLDAGAKKISVIVDVGGWGVKVVDNGSGITRDGLELLGERYASSRLQLLTDKDPGNATFGFRGEALSSISDVSLVEVVTKTYGRAHGYRKVLKGCRCLHLGIDDSRHDIGTTVIVRDLFYNQPVRRKQIQSSPRKVLHSIKKCVLRVALVHSNVYFTVVDFESEETLLNSEPSSSLLPLLLRGFETEISSSLQKVCKSDGILQLSGFISGPCDTFSPQGLQYLYINSRYICKGPIHKMLNEWASRLTCLDINDGPVSKKKARFQAYPMYILNLICPRSSYHLNFEPSKTCVEFKDWASVLKFIQNAITPIWNRKAEEKDALLEKENKLLPQRIQGDVNTKTKFCIEKDTYTFQSKHAFHSQYPYSSEMLLQSNDPVLDKEDHIIPLSKSGKKTSEFRKQNSEMVHVHQDKSFHASSADFCTKSISIGSEDRNDHLWSEVDIDSTENNLLHDDFGVKRSDNFVEDCFFSSAVRDDPCSFVPDKNGSYLSKASHSCYEFDQKLHDRKDLRKPFLQGCSSRGRLSPDDLLHRRDEKIQLCGDVLGTKRKLSCLVEGNDHLENGHRNQNIDFSFGALNQKDSIAHHCSDIVGRKYDKCRQEDFLDSFSFDEDNSPVADDLPPDGLLHRRDEKTQLCGDDLGTKRKRSRLVEGNDHLENGHSNQNTDFSFGALNQKDSIAHHCSGIVGRKYDKCGQEDFLDSFSFDEDISPVADHLPQDGLLYCRHDETQPSRDGFRTKRKLSSLTEGLDNLEAKHVYQNSDFLSGSLYQKHSICNYSSDIVGRKYIKHGEVYFDGSFSYDGDICSITGHISPGTIAETVEYDPEQRVEPAFRTRSWSNYQLSHEQRADRRLKFDMDVNYDDFIDETYTNGVFANNDLPDSSQERWLPSLGLDFKDCFGQKRDACKYPCPDYQKDLSFSRCSSISTADVKLSPYLDSSFKIGSNDYAGPSHLIPASKSVLIDKQQCESLRNQYDYLPPKEKLRRSRSAPPFYRGKRFFAVSWDMMTGAVNSRNLDEVSPLDRSTTDRLPLISSLKCRDGREKEHLQRYLDGHLHSQPTFLGDPILDKRPDMKKATDAYCDRNEIKTSLGKLKDSALKNTNSWTEATGELIHSGIKWPSSTPSSAVASRCHLQDKLRDVDQCDILNISSGILHLVGDSLVPESMNKKCLEEARVLQQVGKKFIPIVAKGILAIIDQHAADERIRLEELRAKLLSGQFKTTSYLESEQELAVPEIEYQLLQKYAKPIQNWGWICNIHAQASKSFSKNLNLLHRQPAAATILAVPCILGVKLSDLDLLEYLHQLADTDGSSTMPPAVLRVLNNKACRGAIMFGDTLLPSECSLLVDELKQTALSFQCAHGRPTTVPLVNLESLHRQIAKLELLSDDGSNNSWHGLRRQEISMPRAAQRLKSTRDQPFVKDRGDCSAPL